MCKAEIITIGDEILIGQILDSNSAWIAKELNLIGIQVKQISSVSDDKQHIYDALKEAETRADIVLITGGLGPTKDDITKDALCSYFDTKLIVDASVLKRVEDIFKVYKRSLLDSNKKQAEVPDSCRVLDNKLGTAPGMLFSKGNKTIVSMPGVPYEMKGIMVDFVLPLLADKTTEHIVHKTILTQGVGESILAEKLKEWEFLLEGKNIKLAYLPSPGSVRLRLTKKGSNKDLLNNEIEIEIEKLYSLIPKYIFGKEQEKMEQVIGELLRKDKLTISTAESCTGGAIAHKLTGIPGSSDYFQGSVVAYSNDVKINILGVSEKVINQYGAVSEEVAMKMATSIRRITRSDYGISCTGIAGPGGGSDDKPIGTVWIGFSFENESYAKCFHFGNNRTRNIEITVLTALNLLRLELLKLN